MGGAARLIRTVQGAPLKRSGATEGMLVALSSKKIAKATLLVSERQSLSTMTIQSDLHEVIHWNLLKKKKNFTCICRVLP